MLRAFLVLSAVTLSASAAFAGIPAPAPALGASIPGIALLGILGAGYAVLRYRRRSRAK